MEENNTTMQKKGAMDIMEEGGGGEGVQRNNGYWSHQGNPMYVNRRGSVLSLGNCKADYGH